MNNFFTSNWEFSIEENELKSKFQMINIALLLSSISLIYAIIRNVYRDISGLIPIELTILAINILLFFALRRCRNSFAYVSFVATLQFTLLFLFLIYISDPQELRHIWIFIYPLLLLYFQSTAHAKYWFALTMVFLIAAPLQPFVSVAYNIHQVTYIAFVLSIISIVIFFYQKKMQEAKELILKQQNIMDLQSKHAIMGEMISMIAHQWRQPLSTVTLSISNLQIKKLLGGEVESELTDKTLEEISNQILYLSQTIDDFQTFFNPQRSLEEITTEELLKKIRTFVLPRLKDSKIEFSLEIKENTTIETYTNEVVQVILNLVNNAIDALLESQQRLGKLLIKAQGENGFVKISVVDNADGISQDVLEKIFDPYFSTKGKNGTGLGLYMSQMIMQKQFGTQIEVQSSSKGSTFAIMVPKKLQ